MAATFLQAVIARFLTGAPETYISACGRPSIISSLVAGFHLFDVQGMLFAYLRLEAFEVTEVLLRQLLFRCRAPIPDDDERTRIHPMRLLAEGLHPLFTKATLILTVAHRLMISERSGGG